MDKQISVEEAIKYLCMIPIPFISGNRDCDTEESQKYSIALSMGVKALEREPCKDTISRQAMFDILVKYKLHESKIAEELEELPPVNPTKTGHWILTSDDDCEYCTCSECGYQNRENWMIGSVIKFCQECGAKMIEPQERSGEE